MTIFKLTEALPGRTYPFAEAQAHVAKNLRRYSASSVAQLVLAQMRESAGLGKLNGLRGTPWLAMLILKWGLLDPKVRLEGGEAMPKKVYDGLRQRLWDVKDAHEGVSGDFNLHLMIRRVMHPQFGFQASDTKYLLLWPTLMLPTDPQSVLRARFREAMLMEPEDFLDLSLVLFAALGAGGGEVSPSYFNLLRTGYGEKIDNLIGLFARDLSGLRAALQADPAQAVRHRNELSESPFTQRWPLVRMQSGKVAWWHRKVFAQGLEMAIHNRLSQFQQEYTNAFSRLFEQFVTEVVIDTGLSCITEEQYKAALGMQSGAVEAIVRPGSCNVLVEAKMGLFPETVLISDNDRVVHEKLKRVRQAIAQAADVAAALQDPRSPFYDPTCLTNYALVVTSRELNVSTGEALQLLFPDRQISFSSDAARRALPLENVFVVSPQEFDRFFGVVRTGKVKLHDTLAMAVANNRSAVNRKMFLSQHYAAGVGRLEVPKRIDAAIRAAVTRVSDHMGIRARDFEEKLARVKGVAA